MSLSSDQKTEINIEFQRLYDEGMRAGKHGHYETMFGAMHAAYASAGLVDALKLIQGWRESDWPSWFDRRTAQALADYVTERSQLSLNPPKAANPITYSATREIT